MLTAGIDIGHLVKTIVSLAASTWDMYSDVSLGLYYYHPKNVTRYLENSTVIPDNCVPCPESNSNRMFECLEEDRSLAMQTFGCIFAPSIGSALGAVEGVILRCWTRGFYDVEEKKVCCNSCFTFFIRFPFPFLCLPYL